MGMTIGVYRVSPETGERTVVRKRYMVRPGTEVPLHNALPPCQCSRCAALERAGGRRDPTGTVQPR